MNLYEETIDRLKEEGFTVDDIAYVKVGKHYCKPEGFLKRAKDINYNSGIGHQEINSYIEIVLKNGGFLEREEDCGCEWWKYVEPKPFPAVLEDFPDDVIIHSEDCLLW